MEITLTDILRNALIGKRIKLYKYEYANNGVDCYFTNNDLFGTRSYKFIEETFGIITNIETDEIQYEGDFYDFTITDKNGLILNAGGLYSITSKLEILDDEN